MDARGAYVKYCPSHMGVKNSRTVGKIIMYTFQLSEVGLISNIFPIIMTQYFTKCVCASVHTFLKSPLYHFSQIREKHVA